ncbi:serine/threonine-protein kinase [Streptomyces sp. NPDC017940]|uniref:serine/threonine-protein kinase n=1 Tax=Streptomyces sp. NPDC017940 TaxID=3365017 RepID=UPI0037BA1F4F
MHPLEPDEPTAIGPYRLLGRLGSGGMGRVYLGRSAGGRTVAVKVVHPHFAQDREFRARFRREVDAARRAGGAWTAPVLDADPQATVPWVATGYAAGPSLTDAVREGGPLPGHSARVLAAGLAEALTHMHGIGLVHRDVKPSNVLLTLDGPCLIDFGIARATEGTATLTALTSTGVSLGSPGYMAPEQILGRAVDGAADVFSLGAVLVFGATGRAPFPGDSTAALLYKVVHEQPDLGGLSGDLRDLAAACLHKDPAARPAPAELSRRLAPAGAAALVAAGWLPGPLVERVSRSAVRLLNLDAGAGGAAAGPPGDPVPASGPVPFTGPAAGAFGPPDASYGATSAPSHAPGDSSRPGRLSLSVAAAATPARSDGRGRKVSCTVVLAAAGALAAVTVGSVFVFGLLPKDGDDNKDAAGRTPSATGGARTPADGAVPVRYLGTWRGKASAQEGLVPLGTFDVTVRQAPAKGRRIGTVTQTDLIGNKCVDILTLKSASAKELVATGTGAESNEKQCSQTAHTVRLRPVGSELQYTSVDPGAGDPEARLRKVD